MPSSRPRALPHIRASAFGPRDPRKPASTSKVDGHTLGAVIEATERLTGCEIERAAGSISIACSGSIAIACSRPLTITCTRAAAIGLEHLLAVLAAKILPRRDMLFVG
jgi:hypothetical protein